MNKKVRQQVYDKYNGLCAYTGKPLGNDWQVDHVTSKWKHEHNSRYICSSVEDLIKIRKEVEFLDNLLPAIKIVNHYKRSLDLEGFRNYMLHFHERLSKLPKNTKVKSTRNRKEYLYKVAELFEISVDKPFPGVFFFESKQLNKQP